METIWNEFLDLKEQCGIIKFLVNLIPTNQLAQWQKDTLSLPKNTVNFARRYLIYSLSNGTNLQKWKKTGTSNYQLFQYKETQLHLFNHCTAALKRYEWRHDSFIQTIMNTLVTIASETCRLYADINRYECRSTLFKSESPNGKKCWKILKSHDYKIRIEISESRSALLNPSSHFKLILLEISSLDFTGS